MGIDSGIISYMFAGRNIQTLLYSDRTHCTTHKKIVVYICTLILGTFEDGVLVVQPPLTWELKLR